MPELRASRAESSITGVEAIDINVEALRFDNGASHCIAAVPDANDQQKGSGSLWEVNLIPRCRVIHVLYRTDSDPLLEEA